MKLSLEGIVPAAFTPMKLNGDINFDVIDDYVRYFEREKVSNVFVLGSAGEGCSLTVDERKQVAERWIAASKNRITNVIIHVGACNIAETKALAEHAESIGATAIATLPSLYFKPSSVKQVALYLSEIAMAAPKTPLMFYHIPVMSGVSIKVEKLFDEIEKIGMPTFAGVKYTSHDLCDFGRIVERYGEKYSVCYGYDEQCYAGMVLGCQTCVGSTYNFAIKLYQRLYEACKNEDVKNMRVEQFRSQKMISYLFKVGFDVGLAKALMTPIVGIDFGPPRLPIAPSPKEKVDDVITHFRKMGFFDWIK